MGRHSRALACLCVAFLVTTTFGKPIAESPVGDWNVAGVETIKLKGGGSRTAFEDSFSFHGNGTCTTIEGLEGTWYQDGTKLVMQVDPGDVVDLMNQYFDDLGYGGVIVVDGLDSFRQICTVKNGVLQGNMKSRLILSVPGEGVHGLKLGWTAKWLGLRD